MATGDVVARLEMKRYLTSFLCILAWIAAAGACAETVRLDGVAAVVNEHMITIGDALTALQPIRAALAPMHTGKELEEKVKEAYVGIVDSLVERHLILDSFEERELQLPEWIVEQRIDEITAEMFGGDRGRLLEALAEDGVTLEEWREEVRDHLAVMLLRKSTVEDSVRIPTGAMRQAYEEDRERYSKPAEAKLRMIVLSASSQKGDASPSGRAERIAKELADGAKFADLARSESDGARAARGGDWGWVNPTHLRKELATSVTELVPGQVSRAVNLDGDLYILAVEEKRGGGAGSFLEVRAEIEREFRDREAGRLYAAWIDRLKTRAFVKIYDVDLF